MASIAIPIITSLIGAASGALGNRASTQSAGPRYSPAQQGLLDSLLRGFQNNINMAGSGGLLQSILNSGLDAIGKKTKGATELINNLLTSRGLSRTTGGASMLFNPIYAGMTEKAKLVGQAPQLQYDLVQDALAKSGNFFNQMQTDRTQTNPGNILGGLATGAGAGLASGLGYYQATQQNKTLQDILARASRTAPIAPTSTLNAGGINPSYQLPSWS